MAASRGTIEQLARDTARLADPETALRALTALRQELDATEPELVLRALQAGASWSRIARALGISKQAAHRKYRYLFDHAMDASTGGPKLLVTPEARQSMQFAREEAKRLGQPAVGTEHVLLGILHCRESYAVRALNALGVTLETARECLRTTMPGLTPKSSHPEPSAPVGVTPQARRIVEGSLREALKRGEGHIGVEHVLLALLSDSRSGAVQTLEALRTTPSAIRRRLERERSGPDEATTLHATVSERPAGSPAPPSPAPPSPAPDAMGSFPLELAASPVGRPRTMSAGGRADRAVLGR
ncbi:MAG: Clp protease N-terminal domain-containing protein [Solirubrobacteraceae bacterium]